MANKKKKLTMDEELASISNDEIEAKLDEAEAKVKDGKDNPIDLDDNLAFKMKPSLLELYKIYNKPEDIKELKEYVDPPSECSLCKKPFMTEKYLIDGRLTSSPGFLIMCESCFLEHGAGFGKGRGQIYARHPEEDRWILISKNIENMTKSDDELCALDNLFKSSRLYRSSQSYMDLLNFITKFRQYAPFNCMLMHIQNPNISYVASAVDWKRGFNRYPKRNARPLLILQPFSPVMFLYDILDTEGDQVPDYVMKPFDTQGEFPLGLMDKTIHNCGIQGIDVRNDINGLLKAGNARRLSDKSRSEFSDLNLSDSSSYLVLLNKDHSPEEQYATLAHELGHIFGGHIGIDKLAWWDANVNISDSVKEIESETVAYLVCRRMGLIASSDKYLSAYTTHTEQEIPFFGLNTVFQATDYIEKMGESKWSKPKRKP